MNDRRESRGHRGVQRFAGWRRVAKDRGQERHLIGTRERTAARGQLVEHDAEREDVRARIGRPALGLLGRHVGHRTDDRARLREHVGRRHGRRVETVVERRARDVRGGEAEVEYPQPAVVPEHDVVGLQIAVHDAPVVRGREGVRDRDRELQHPRSRKAAGRELAGQRVSLDQLHRQERAVARFFHRVDGDDVRMVERGQGARLAAETLEPLRISGQRHGKSLERHRPAEPRVLGPPDLAHTACAQLGDDLVGAEHHSGGERHRCAW